MPIEGSLVGRINELTFFDHDFHNKKKFLNFVPQYNMYQTMFEKGRPPVLKFQQWALGLELLSITQLLDVTHFGRSLYITNCVNTLLGVVHGGYLCLNPPVSIDVELIHRIIGLPIVEEDPSSLFADKKTDRVAAAQITTEYNLQRGNRGLLVKDISDKVTQFGAQILIGKLLRH